MRTWPEPCLQHKYRNDVGSSRDEPKGDGPLGAQQILSHTFMSHGLNGTVGLSGAPDEAKMIARPGDQILVTGANGFIGSWVLRILLARGFRNIRCLTRASSGLKNMDRLRAEFGDSCVEVVSGNLLSRSVCSQLTEGVSVVYHLAAGVEKTFPGCFLNSAVTTRNLLDAVTSAGTVKRFVNISSLAVYSNSTLGRGAVIDERCPIDSQLVERFDPYAYGKAKQDEIVRETMITSGGEVVNARVREFFKMPALATAGG